MSENYYTEKEAVLEQIAELRAAVADLSARVGEVLKIVRAADAPMTVQGYRHSAPGAHLLEVTAEEFRTTRELQQRLDEMGVTHASAAEDNGPSADVVTILGFDGRPMACVDAETGRVLAKIDQSDGKIWIDPELPKHLEGVVNEWLAWLPTHLSSRAGARVCEAVLTPVSQEAIQAIRDRRFIPKTTIDR